MTALFRKEYDLHFKEQITHTHVVKSATDNDI